jgi:VanZ family protein
MTPHSSRRRLAWTAAVAWYGVILLATLPATVAKEMPEIPHLDKIFHFGAFAVQGGLLSLAMGPGWAALGLTSLLGALDEGLQTFFPGRTCELADWLADTAGAGLAVVTLLAWARWRGRTMARGPE